MDKENEGPVFMPVEPVDPDCRVCLRVFSPKVRVSCVNCNLDFSTRTELETHFGPDSVCPGQNPEGPVKLELSEDFPMPEFKCSVCEKGFPTALKLTNHVSQTHVKSEQNEATNLLETILDDDEENDDEFVLTNSDGNECQLCEERFDGTSELEQHVRVEHPGIVHFCDICGTEFGTYRAFKEHTKTCQKSTAMKSTCHTCQVAKEIPNRDCIY